MTVLANITLADFESYRTGPKNWAYIPIQLLDVFRALVPASQYKYNFIGLDRKGRPSYLKLYAHSFSVCFRESEVEFHSAKRVRKQALRDIRKLMRSFELTTADIR